MGNSFFLQTRKAVEKYMRYITHINFWDISQTLATGGRIYYLRLDSELVVRNDANGYIGLSSLEDNRSDCPLLLYIPNGNNSYGFLFSGSGWNNLIVLCPTLTAKMIIPIKLYFVNRNKIQLKDQRTMSYITIYLDAAESAPGMLSATAPSVSSSRLFELVRAEIVPKSPSMRRSLKGIKRISTFLDRSLRNPRSVRRETLIKRVVKLVNSADSNLIDYCMGYFSRELYEDIASLVLTNDIEVPCSLSHVGQDMFLQDSLRRYAKESSVDLDRHGSIKEIGPNLDRLDTIGYNGCFNSFGHYLNFCARYILEPHKKVCIVTSARNEGLYLLDWVSYHKSIGFDQIFIYSNDNEDGSDDILRILAENNEIVWYRNITAEFCRPQAKAYGHAFGLSEDIIRYQWAAVIDLDEFIVVDSAKFNSFKDFLAAHENVDSDVIHLNWNMMTSCKQTKYEQRSVLERFDYRTNHINMHTKCLFKTNLAMHSSPHYPILGGHKQVKHVSADGSLFRSTVDPALSDTPMIKPACVNHYYYKSAEEFVVKFSRSRGFDMINKNLTCVVPADLKKDFQNQFMSVDVVVDRTILSRIEVFNSYHMSLIILPGMNDAFKKCQYWYMNHSKTLNMDIVT